MDKKTLTTLFSEKLFRIPDYQRGYAWEEQQWSDFIGDVDALVNEDVKTHYTGTLVTYQDRGKSVEAYGSTDKLEVVDVVDGQQRLTTSCLYLSIIIQKLVQQNCTDYQQKIPLFLYSGETCKLKLNNDTQNHFYDLLKTGHANTPATSTHQRRLQAAHAYFVNHLEKQLALKSDCATQYLRDLYDAITRKMVFTFYTIEEECEIGMTFELMNSRGKNLSVLELLKNYLMHWVSRNEVEEGNRRTLTAMVNRNWKDTYINVGSCAGSEDQCLRIAWTLFCNHTPKNWTGYQGFKQEDHIPLRNFGVRSRESTKEFIEQFSDGLSLVSRHYASAVSPTETNTPSKEERNWNIKIQRTGNTANFLPLLVALRIGRERGHVTEQDSIKLLRAVERFAYRVFLFAGKRSNAGKSGFHKWAWEILHRSSQVADVADWVDGLTLHYVSEAFFQKDTREPSNWYASRNLLRYTLFEYELHLLATEGKGKAPSLAWEQLNDSTIEHVLPQNPYQNSRWRELWSPDQIKMFLHDIGNLVLTQNNSNYLNFEFSRKKGMPGQSPSYSNSDIRQERKLAAFEDWGSNQLGGRRAELCEWILSRWSTAEAIVPLPILINESDDADADAEPLAGKNPIQEPSI